MEMSETMEVEEMIKKLSNNFAFLSPERAEENDVSLIDDLTPNPIDEDDFYGDYPPIRSVSDSDLEVQTLELKMKNAYERESSLLQEIERLKGYCREMEGKAGLFENQSNHCGVEMRGLKKRLEESNEKRLVAEEELHSTKKEITELRTKLRAREDRVENLEEEMGKVREEVGRVRGRDQCLKERVEESNDLIVQLKSRLHTCESEKMVLGRQLGEKGSFI